MAAMLTEEAFPELQQIEQGLKSIQMNVTKVRYGDVWCSMLRCRSVPCIQGG